MKLRFALTFTLICAVVFCGCRKHPELPRSRNDLVLRFLHSLKNNDAASAMEQGHKLLAMDSSNSFIIKIIEVQECNQAVLNAQQKINASDVQGALDILRECERKYPENNTLPQLYAQVKQLRHAERLLGAMERADTAEAMSSAMTAAQTGLSANISPALKQYFADYEKAIAKRREEEARAIQLEEKRLPAQAPAPAENEKKPPLK